MHRVEMLSQFSRVLEKKEFPPCVTVNGDVSDEAHAMPKGVLEL